MSRVRSVAGFLLRELLVSLGVLIALLLIAVALTEGPALDQFLYAIF